MCGMAAKQPLSPSQRDEPRLGHERDGDTWGTNALRKFLVRMSWYHVPLFVVFHALRAQPKQATHQHPPTTTGFPWVSHPPAPRPVATRAAAATALLPSAVSHAIKNAKCKCASHTQNVFPRSIKAGEPKKHRPPHPGREKKPLPSMSHAPENHPAMLDTK